jgi:hypothetical protein
MPARACSGSEPRTEAAVRAAEDRWVHLLEARDVGGLACLLAPEFTDTNWLGRKVARASVLAALPHRPDSRLTLSEVVVRTYGTVAIVQGLNRQTDRAGRAAGAVRFTDIFLYRERRWQAVFAQETPAPAAR